MDIEAVEVEKDDIQEFFEKHNFAKEFSQNWTIFIEKKMVSAWMKEMKTRYPEPKSVQGNGLKFQTPVKDRTVFSTFYDVDIPKINIQGNHDYKRICYK